MRVAVADDDARLLKGFPLEHRRDGNAIEAALALAFIDGVVSGTEAIVEGLRGVERAGVVELATEQTVGAGTETERGLFLRRGIFRDVVDDAAGLGLAVEEGGRAFEGFDARDGIHVGRGEATDAIAHGGGGIEAADVGLRDEFVERARRARDDVEHLIKIEERAVHHELFRDDVDLHGQIADGDVGAGCAEGIGGLIAAVVVRVDLERREDDGGVFRRKDGPR